MKQTTSRPVAAQNSMLKSAMLSCYVRECMIKPHLLEVGHLQTKNILELIKCLLYTNKFLKQIEQRLHYSDSTV